MALSNAERQKRHRQRLRDRALRNDAMQDVEEAVRPLAEAWWAEHGSPMGADDEARSAEEEADSMLTELRGRISNAVEGWLRDNGFTHGEDRQPIDDDERRVAEAARRLVPSTQAP